jgi:catechol 2,3-dioxygenase-like lactoylglutathione lyase family enzyme
MPAVRTVETCLYTDDLPRAVAFYEELLGFTRMVGDDRFAALAVSAGQVLLTFRRGGTLEPVRLPGGVIPAHDGSGPLHIGFGIRAAVYERNPSINRKFVEPLLHTLGHSCVVEALLKFVEGGTDFEKAGAVNALYWTGLPSRYAGDYGDLSEMKLRRRCLMLREFVANPSVDVRRSIIAGLSLDPAVYPKELRPLVDKAIRIARAHPDDYIRWRVEVQLGTGQAIPSLPERGA